MLLQVGPPPRMSELAAEALKLAMEEGGGQGTADPAQAAFAMFDVDGNGSISTSELRELFKRLGQEPTEEEMRVMVEEVDLDGSGTVDFWEFKRMMKIAEENTQERQLAAAKFKVGQE